MKIHRRILVTYSIIIFIGVLAYIGRTQIFPNMSTQDNVKLFFIMAFVMGIVWEYIRFLNSHFSRKYPLDRKPVPRIVWQILLSVAGMYVIRWSVFPLAMHYFKYQFSGMFKISVFVLDFFFMCTVNLIFFAREYFYNWKESITKAERLEKEKTQVQFDNLKNQLNPHFLFNALTSLNSLIFSDQVLASRFLQHMSKVYRYLLQNRNREVVSVGTELEFIRDYIFLIKTRFNDSVHIHFNIADNAREKGIVPVTLQILIENALKHNVLSKTRILNIVIRSDGEHLTISNNIQRKNIVETSNKQGLDNMRSLYAYLAPIPVKIEDDGHTFTVDIPLISL